MKKAGAHHGSRPQEEHNNASILMDNPTEAMRFLALLGKDPATCRLRFFAHKHNPRKQQIGARKLVGVNPDRIAQYQREGRGAYVAIGNSDGQGDEKKNIIDVPALFNEWDDRPIEWQLTAWKKLHLPEPSIQVKTGGVSVQTYWVLDTPMAPQEWEQYQARLIRHSGSDPACSDASRVMRLPGCAYIGADGTPTGQCRIVGGNGQRYRASEILPGWLDQDEFSDEPEPPQAAAAPPAGGSASSTRDYPPRTLEEVRMALQCIPAILPETDQRETFRKLIWSLLCAVREASADDAMALDLIEKHSPQVVDAADYLKTEPNKITSRSFWRMAIDHGWRPARHGAEDHSDFPDDTDDDEHQAPRQEQEKARPYIVLGWGEDRERVWCRHGQTSQIFSIRPNGQPELMKLAHLSYWYDRHPRHDKENKLIGVKWANAADELIKAADAAGVFRSEQLRGRGVWMDGGRVVWHLGDRLEVDGTPVPLTQHISAKQYALLQRLAIDPAVEPLDDDHGRKILQVLRQTAWIGASDHLHLAGFCVLSNVCGALEKRPGLQISSPFSSGKTDTIDHVIMPLQGGAGLLSSGSTEAGVRQLLGNDALPATIDESEAEDGRRRDAQLRLVRYSYDGKQVLRGTPGPQALRFCLRSSIALAGINSPIDNPADRSRIAVISRRHLDADRWAAVSRQRAELITEAIGQRLIRRTVSTLPALLANVETFDTVISGMVTTGDAGRTGDTWGALLAGAHHLCSTAVLSEAQARAWLDSVGWHLSHTDADDQDRRAGAEGRQCLDHLLSCLVPWREAYDPEAGRPSTGSITVRELVALARRPFGAEHREAELELGRLGLRAMLAGLAVANNAPGTARIFRNTKWEKGAHKGRLLELDGVEKQEPIHFPASGTRRLVLVPWRVVGDLGDEEPVQVAA